MKESIGYCIKWRENQARKSRISRITNLNKTSSMSMGNSNTGPASGGNSRQSSKSASLTTANVNLKSVSNRNRYLKHVVEYVSLHVEKYYLIDVLSV